MKEMWNERYADADYAYGTEPNSFFSSFIEKNTPGKILLPADGEGRNSCYAAQKGWNVHSFDFSENAREKALQLYSLYDLNVEYKVQNIEDFVVQSETYDAVALIFVHLESTIRTDFHKKLIESLKPGGKIVFQAFSKKQIDFKSGGPKDVNLLYSIKEIRNDFGQMKILLFEEKYSIFEEGQFHSGPGWVVNLIAEKS